MLALDGHDASGKTTLSKRLAQELGGVVVRPFSGKYGKALELAASSEEIWSVAMEAIGCASNPKSPLEIWDRYLLTPLSMVPQRASECRGASRTTILCWSDLDTTMRRLEERGEGGEGRAWHLQYLNLYRTLAEKLGIPILRTDQGTVDEIFQKLLAWAKSKM